jgi:hypothetical protein
MSRYTHVKMIVCYFSDQYTNLETGPICKQSKWKVVEKSYGNNDSAVGATTVKIQLLDKILPYIPLIPRLQKCICQSKCQRICSGT